MDPKVVVLVLSYNGKNLLPECVTSYLENDYANFEVVVIDNGSTDGTDNFLKKEFNHVYVLRIENNLGYSGGFNIGLDFAFNKINAEYALVTNNDVKADRHVVSALVAVAEKEEKIGFVTGKVYYFDQTDLLQTVGKNEDPIYWKGGHIGNKKKDEGQYDQIVERAWADDIFTLVSRKLYKEIGGYDPMFFLQAEEYDWQARAKKAGYKIFYTPYAKIWHKESMTIGKDSPLKAYYDARNPMLVILKHQTDDFFRQYFWHHFWNDIVKASIRHSMKKGGLIKAEKTWAGFLSGLWWGIRNRRFTLRHFMH